MNIHVRPDSTVYAQVIEWKGRQITLESDENFIGCEHDLKHIHHFGDPTEIAMCFNCSACGEVPFPFDCGDRKDCR